MWPLGSYRLKRYKQLFKNKKSFRPIKQNAERVSGKSGSTSKASRFSSQPCPAVG